jgi:hypothetical protein
MPVSKNKRKKAKFKSGKNRTSLLDHKKIGKELSPPFNQSEFREKIVFSSWLNKVLPEVLWIAIIRTSNSQEDAITEFRRIIRFVKQYQGKSEFNGVGFSDIEILDEKFRSALIGCLVSNPKTALALSSLRLIDYLPGMEFWDKYLPQIQDDVLALNILMKAIGLCIDHQSQESTDCRWLIVMLYVAGGKLSLPPEMLELYVYYPNKGEQRKVRPSIRACEMAIRASLNAHKESNWAEKFFQEFWEKSPCFELIKHKNDASNSIYLDDINELEKKLKLHWKNTHVTTAVDAKHDSVFGITFYSLAILKEIILSDTTILCRLGLRSILELRITLKYMSSQRDDGIWLKWRQYGAGQAKLNALRFDELIDAPEFIDVSTIETISNEDTWDEFLNINLGNWSNSDLRKMSIEAGLKDIYDKYYSWTSGYVHGSWGAVRETCFEICGNPLHRLHRYPSYRFLPTPINDICYLFNCILDDLDTMYPTFEYRLKGS